MVELLLVFFRVCSELVCGCWLWCSRIVWKFLVMVVSVMLLVVILNLWYMVLMVLWGMCIVWYCCLVVIGLVGDVIVG